MSTYEPATVAIATVRGVPNVRVYRCEGYSWRSADVVGRQVTHADHDVTDVRPLIVLDLAHPQGMVQALRHACENDDSVVAPLTNLADQIEQQTNPPRNLEPGLWGVVEAGSNAHPTRRKWVHYGMGWRDLTGNPQQWDDLIDPVLIRDGIEATS